MRTAEFDPPSSVENRPDIMVDSPSSPFYISSFSEELASHCAFSKVVLSLLHYTFLSLNKTHCAIVVLTAPSHPCLLLHNCNLFISQSAL